MPGDGHVFNEFPARLGGRLRGDRRRAVASSRGSRGIRATESPPAGWCPAPARAWLVVKGCVQSGQFAHRQGRRRRQQHHPVAQPEQPPGPLGGGQLAGAQVQRGDSSASGAWNASAASRRLEFATAPRRRRDRGTAAGQPDVAALLLQTGIADDRVKQGHLRAAPAGPGRAPGKAGGQGSRSCRSRPRSAIGAARPRRTGACTHQSPSTRTPFGRCEPSPAADRVGAGASPPPPRGRATSHQHVTGGRI